MNVKHLEYFATVAQYKSINKAAQELFISQPHLSHIIKDMEEDIGTPLLDRTKTGVSLTTAGENFLQHSQVILREMNNLKTLSCKIHSSTDTLSLSMTKFSHTMESFNSICGQNQDREVFSYKIMEGTTQDVIEHIRNDEFNIGVIHYTKSRHEHFQKQLEEYGIVMKRLATLSTHICVSKNHELYKLGKEITLENLKNYGFVRYFGQYEDFIYSIATSNLDIDLNNNSKIAYVYGRSALLHLVGSSNFYTIGIQGFSTQDSMYDVLSVPINNCADQLNFAVIYKKDIKLCETEKAFIEDVSDRYRRLEQEE